MKNYQTPEINLVQVESRDVISTSTGDTPTVNMFN